MILVDTSTWIDHVQRRNPLLEDLLIQERVITHPFVIGELAIGRFASRNALLEALTKLPHMVVATPDEVLGFIDANLLFGVGIGYVDVSLLASLKLTPGTSLLTQDKRLRDAATTLSVLAKVTH